MILGGILISVGCMSIMFGVAIYVSELPTITYINPGYTSLKEYPAPKFN
jgi:hypothetical protein